MKAYRNNNNNSESDDYSLGDDDSDDGFNTGGRDRDRGGKNNNSRRMFTRDAIGSVVRHGYVDQNSLSNLNRTDVLQVSCYHTITTTA